MGIVKAECVHARTYATREEAALDLFEYIEVVYNRARIHSALGYFSPVEFEVGQLARRRRPPEGGVKGVNGIGVDSLRVVIDTVDGFISEDEALCFPVDTPCFYLLIKG